MKIKELWQKVVSKEKGLQLITRYSVPLAFVIALTLWFDYLIISRFSGDSNLETTISLTLCFGLFWAVAQQMSPDRMRKDENGSLLVKPILIQLLGQLIIIAEATILYHFGSDFSDATSLGHWSVICAALVCAGLLPFIRHKSDRHIVRWSTDYCLTGMACCLVVGTAIGLSAALLVGISELFELNIRDKVYGVIFCTIATLGGGGLMLLLLPDAEKTNKISQTSEQFGDRMGKFLLLPSACIYILVLYAYIIKIIAAWELPNGGVAWMTTAMMVITLLTLFMRYKALYTEEDSTGKRAVRMGLPIATLPCLILMVIGFIRRVHDYGWTPTRGYLCAVIVWFFFVIGLLLWADLQKRKGQTPRIISLTVISLSLLFVATSVVPKANIYTICSAVQSTEEPIVSTPKTWSETHTIVYNLENKTNGIIPIPEGYSTFREIYERDHKLTSPTRDKEGRLVLEFYAQDKWYTVHFDDSQEGEYADMYTESGQLIRAYGLTIIEYEGEIYINYLNGYLFEK